MKIIRIGILLILTFILLSCTKILFKNEKVIVIKGSDTMYHLTKKLSESFHKSHPNINFYVYGGGTKTGIEELLVGKIDICTASRDLTSAEAKKLAKYYGSVGMYYLIAKDAVCIYANPNCKIKNVSLNQLNKLFTCKENSIVETRSDEKVVKLAIRNSNSGTRKFIKDLVLGNDKFCKDAIEFSTTKEIVNFVKKNKNSFGFGGIGLSKGVKNLHINGIAPTVKNIKSDKYPLTRYLHFFTSRSSAGAVGKFINWVLGPNGQKIIKQEGFVPLWEINY